MAAYKYENIFYKGTITWDHFICLYTFLLNYSGNYCYVIK